MLLNEGDVIRETYTVDRFLGQGAFAEVYRVKHRFMRRQLAMKVFKLLGTIEDTQSALEEAIILSDIGHRNVIRVFDLNMIETANGTRGFFTMEYVGGTLQDFWRGYCNEFVPLETSIEIVKQVCRGLNVAHRDNPPIVHRDIKPHNILVGYDESGLRACLTDFGLAKRVNPLMQKATARGTPCFKAPETFLDPMSDSCAGDVWAAGVTLYLLLTDRFPFEPPQGDCTKLDYRCFQHPLIPPSRWNIQVDPMLDQILYRALEIEREKRYQNAGELLEELNRWQPRPTRSVKDFRDNLSSENSKDVLGAPVKADEAKIREMVTQAIQLSQERGRLREAADLMEEALNQWPALREDYEQDLKRWRAGIVSNLQFRK
jgi:eukaryotic-like serine/threonine-protein kinase